MNKLHVLLILMAFGFFGSTIAALLVSFAFESIMFGFLGATLCLCLFCVLELINSRMGADDTIPSSGFSSILNFVDDKPAINQKIPSKVKTQPGSIKDNKKQPEFIMKGMIMVRNPYYSNNNNKDDKEASYEKDQVSDEIPYIA